MEEKLTKLIWIDLEMTGLDPLNDKIIEIATIVTDNELNVIAEGPNLAIHQSRDVLAKMDEWNTKHHGSSGLTQRVQQSKITEKEAEQQTLYFLKQHVREKTSPMCGNTICQDRRFLHRHMPTLEAYFHYRHLDVSTIKSLAMMWAPEVYQGLTKASKHLALEDIKESIGELKYYRTHFFHLLEKTKEA